MTIRTLRDDEPIPAGEPKRYADSRGYIRLRWLVAPNQYVEQYEHRIVAGRPPVHVHHDNEIKGDNSPGNLIPLTVAEHARLHGSRAIRQFAPYRSRSDRDKAEREARRRAEYLSRAREMAALYEGGLSTTALGERFGISAGAVSRSLNAVGAPMRPFSKVAYLPPIDRDLVRSMHAAGIRASAMMQRLGVGRGRLYQVFDELGLPRFGAGKPPSLEADGGVLSEAPAVTG